MSKNRIFHFLQLSVAFAALLAPQFSEALPFGSSVMTSISSRPSPSPTPGAPGGQQDCQCPYNGFTPGDDDLNNPMVVCDTEKVVQVEVGHCVFDGWNKPCKLEKFKQPIGGACFPDHNACGSSLPVQKSFCESQSLPVWYETTTECSGKILRESDFKGVNRFDIQTNSVFGVELSPEQKALQFCFLTGNEVVKEEESLPCVSKGRAAPSGIEVEVVGTCQEISEDLRGVLPDDAFAEACSMGECQLMITCEDHSESISPRLSCQTESLPVSRRRFVSNSRDSENQPANYWTNPENSFDVNGDGIVTPYDALIVLNELNAGGAREVRKDDINFIDVNGDHYLSPYDAIAIINELNS